MHLSLGVVDGRNIWKTNCAAALSSLRNAALKLRATGCSSVRNLRCCMCARESGTGNSLDPEIKNWMAFAVQNCSGIALLGQTIDGEWSPECLNENRLASESRHLNMKTFDPAVAGDFERHPSAQRKAPMPSIAGNSREALNLPLFPDHDHRFLS